MQDTVCASYVKLFVHHLLHLLEETPGLYRFYNRRINKAAILGIVVSRKHRSDRVSFVLDDGTGCIDCILWLHGIGSDRSTVNPVKSLQQQRIELGSLLHVYGRISNWDGRRQLVAYNVFLETDPNGEALFVAEVMKITRDHYDK
mmetsp:Transcript_12210/g.22350  ORF Transcript_12210/g.22350 Transcript_12210/m.22350 type:complete len:145 (-) Transcript_12210:151-585(-)